MTICLPPAGTMSYAEGGGHFWAFLNWAPGLRALGHRVIWLELPGLSAERLSRNVPILHRNLARFGLADSLAVGTRSGTQVSEAIGASCVAEEEALDTDLLLAFHYTTATPKDSRSYIGQSREEFSSQAAVNETTKPLGVRSHPLLSGRRQTRDRSAHAIKRDPAGRRGDVAFSQCHRSRCCARAGANGGVVNLDGADRYHLPRIAMGPDTDLRAELHA